MPDPPDRCHSEQGVSKPYSGAQVRVSPRVRFYLRQGRVANLGADARVTGVLGSCEAPDDAEVLPVLRVDRRTHGCVDSASNSRSGGNRECADVTHDSRGGGQGGGSEGLEGNHFCFLYVCEEASVCWCQNES